MAAPVIARVCTFRHQGKWPCGREAVVTVGGKHYCRHHIPSDAKDLPESVKATALVECPESLRMAVVKIVKERVASQCIASRKTGDHSRCRALAKVGSTLCGYHGGPKELPGRWIEPQNAGEVVEDLLGALMAAREVK